MNEHPVILSSRVRLARNLSDVPFRSRMTAEHADNCIERVLSVLRDEKEIYHYFPMRRPSSLSPPPHRSCRRRGMPTREGYRAFRRVSRGSRAQSP